MSMQKFTTEVRPWRDVKPGDRIVVSFGVLTVCRWQEIECARVHVVAEGSHREQYALTYAVGNWPEVVTGFTPEYIASGSL